MTIDIRSDAVIANPAGLVADNPKWSVNNMRPLVVWSPGVNVTDDGSGNITTWVDKINGRVASGVAGTYPKTGYTLNGKVAPRFTNAQLAMTPPAGLSATHLAIFAVVDIQAMTDGVNETFISFPRGQLRVPTSGKKWAAELNGSSSISKVGAGQGLATVGKHILIAYVDATDGLIHLRVDGVEMGTGSTGTLAAWTAGGKLGDYWGAGNADLTDTALGDTGVLTGTFSLTEIQKFEQVLAIDNFGTLTFLPNTHPYYNKVPRRLD